MLGLTGIKKKDLFLLGAVLLLSVLFSMLYRDALHINVLPYHLTPFALTAMCIGSCEELIFRGFLQNRSRKIGILFSILLTAVAHTAYKIVLFGSLQSLEYLNLNFVIFWTLAVGIILGFVKERSGSCLLPIFFHALFDVLSYGDVLIHPWWVFV
jgi:membrane protease YdiL (CAAX protease family)